MIESHDGIRKAAILIDSLDEPTAEVLLGQMSPELAVQVRAARADLGDVALRRARTSPRRVSGRRACGRRRTRWVSRPTRPRTALAEKTAAEVDFENGPRAGPLSRRRVRDAAGRRSDRCPGQRLGPGGRADDLPGSGSPAAPARGRSAAAFAAGTPSGDLQRLGQRESPPSEAGGERGREPRLLPFASRGRQTVPDAGCLRIVAAPPVRCRAPWNIGTARCPARRNRWRRRR